MESWTCADGRTCELTHITQRQGDEAIRRHYLGKWPAVVVCKLGLWQGLHLGGIVVFALPPRETAVRYGGITWELARLWVEDGFPRNVESWLIARAVRHVKRVHPSLEFLVSYADPSAGHTGLIYMASNWVADGVTDEGRKTPRFDYIYGGRRYSRKGHLPSGVGTERVPRVSKARFCLNLERTNRRRGVGVTKREELCPSE